MRGSKIILVSIFILLLLPVVSLSTSSQDDAYPPWDPAFTGWSYRQELTLPIVTNDSAAHCQPIDLRVRFEKPCWTENENVTSIRISCWQAELWQSVDSQIYALTTVNGEKYYLSECNIVFLIPSFADGTERFFMYYTGDRTSKPNYKDYVMVKDMNYSSAPIPELSAQAQFYGIQQEGYCIYAVGQEGQLLDRSCSQVVVKQKSGIREFDITNFDQIVSFAFSYYFGSREKDESASDQVFIDKKIFIDGNLMVEFGIISESKKKDVQTTAIYRYYYCPLEEKRIYVHVKHEMLKDAIVQGIDNIDGRFGSLISLKTRSAAVESLNFGEIHPFLNFYSEKEKIEQFQLNQNPSSKDREWIISYKNDASLGSEAWLSYGEGRKGIANAVLFETNQGVVVSGTDEHDGIQLKVAEKEYLNFLGTEVDYVSINFGRRSFKAGSSHDVMLPSDLLVQFDAEVYHSQTGGYEAVQKESSLYKALIKSRKLSGDIPFEREQKRYNVTIIPRFGGTHVSHPWLSNLTGSIIPVMWIELHRDGRVISEGAAERYLLARAKKTFRDVLEGEYLVKVFFKWGTKKRFTGSEIFHVTQNTKVNVVCTWERTIKFTFRDQMEQGVAGVHAWLMNKDGVVFDENITKWSGELIVKAPYDRKESYRLHAEYKNFVIYDDQLQKTIRRLNKEVTIALYTTEVIVTDSFDFPPGVVITPLLVTPNGNNSIQVIPRENDRGSFIFEDIPAGDYHLQISYAEFLDDIHVTIPTPENVIRMKFSAVFDVIINLYDSKGNSLQNEDIDFVILRDNRTITRTKEKTISLPPARYMIYAYLDNVLVGVKQVELINDRQLSFVTTLESFFPVVLSLFFYLLFSFFVILTLLRKFSLSSLLKALAILLVIFSLFQPWWVFDGVSSTVPAGKTTALYVNPAMMIETSKYHGELSLNIEELPDMFLMFLGGIIPLASLACLSLSIGIILRRTKKKNYAFLLSIIGIILLGVVVPSFVFGTTRLIETSLGAVQGEGVLLISIGEEEVLLKSSWGFAIGFYLVCIGVLVVLAALFIDIRAILTQRKKL